MRGRASGLAGLAGVALGLALAGALGGCAAPPPRAIAPAFGTDTTRGAVGSAVVATYGAPARPVRRRVAGVVHRPARRIVRSHAHPGRAAAAAGPRLDFGARTRARCDAGDAGACRMLRSMGGG